MSTTNHNPFAATGPEESPAVLTTPRRVPGPIAQTSLFDRPAPVDPNLLPSDHPRLKLALGKLLAALRSGPKTNIDLVPVCGIRASARIHDLRECGFNIEAKHQSGGLWLYTLVN